MIPRCGHDGGAENVVSDLSTSPFAEEEEEDEEDEEDEDEDV